MTPTQYSLKMKYGIPKAGALLTVALVFWVAGPSLAEVRTITATGEYRMGDNDTRTDAKRLALLDAKRLALEQAGVYIESITEVKNFDLAKEEIRAYTAGIVEVVEQATRTMMEGESTVVRVDVKTKIDTDVVARQIDTLRKNEDVRTKLLRAESEALKLRKELEVQTHELTAAKSRTVTEAVTKQRQKLMTQADMESLISRARVALTGIKGNTLWVGSSTPESRKYARSLIEQALAYEPENTDAQALLGFVQFEEGQREAAIATYHAIALKEPLSAQVHVNLGKVLEATGDYPKAFKEYEAAIKLEPDLAEAHASFGHALVIALFLPETERLSPEKKREMLDRGIEQFREAIRLAPRNAKYHQLLADALYSRISRTRGILFPEKLCLKGRLSDRRVPSPKNMADKDRKLLEEYRAWQEAQEQEYAHDCDEAMTELRQAVALDPSNAVFRRALGDRLGGEETIAEYRTAVRLDPSDLDTRLNLGTLLLNEKDTKGALVQFEAAVRVNPKSVKAHQRVGSAFEALGQIDRAIDEYRTAVKLGPDSIHDIAPAYVVTLLSEALTKAGKRKEAGQVIRDYLQLEPEGGAMGEAFFRERLQKLERE